MIAALPPSELIEEAHRSHQFFDRPPAIVRVVDDVLESSAIFRSATAAMGMNGVLVFVLNGTGLLNVVPDPSEQTALRGDVLLTPLTIQEMVSSLNDRGLSVSNLATIFGVSRPTVYSWVEGNIPQAAEKQARIETIYRLLSEMRDQDLRLLPKVWVRRPVETIPSLYEVLTGQIINTESFFAALDAAKPLLAKMVRRLDRPTRNVSSLVEETIKANATPITAWDTMPSVGKEFAGGEGV